ncbi:nucleotidyltransferase family protein [Dysgonomonas sp. Marseille-P4361]|uniref:nucleotidyltransferase family protein n=1 Tax=Dysgonomonas sp. Marseille-P4361 TaxID=2161820 RepID=UPI000D553FD6|nr:nucleotidyltransferase family protein [Dysgonomonas sp. Marseille-P4361]
MKEGIILAGGFGTRLQSVVNDVPKSMAEVAGKPFLEHLFSYLTKQGFEHIILSLGYKAEIIIDWIESNQQPFKVSYVIENEPLGTGGGIKYALQKSESDKVFIINGDTFFDVDCSAFQAFHQTEQADLSIALKPMTDFDRYGSVALDGDKRIIAFREKQHCESGLINGGIYLFNKDIFSKLNLPDKFSFEKDIMEAHVSSLRIYGFEQDNYFIDIGIPSDFEKANVDFKTGNLK